MQQTEASREAGGEGDGEGRREGPADPGEGCGEQRHDESGVPAEEEAGGGGEEGRDEEREDDAPGREADQAETAGEGDRESEAGGEERQGAGRGAVPGGEDGREGGEDEQWRQRHGALGGVGEEGEGEGDGEDGELGGAAAEAARGEEGAGEEGEGEGGGGGQSLAGGDEAGGGQDSAEGREGDHRGTRCTPHASHHARSIRSATRDYRDGPCVTWSSTAVVPWEARSASRRVRRPLAGGGGEPDIATGRQRDREWRCLQARPGHGELRGGGWTFDPAGQAHLVAGPGQERDLDGVTVGEPPAVGNEIAQKGAWRGIQHATKVPDLRVLDLHECVRAQHQGGQEPTRRQQPERDPGPAERPGTGRPEPGQQGQHSARVRAPAGTAQVAVDRRRKDGKRSRASAPVRRATALPSQNPPLPVLMSRKGRVMRHPAHQKRRWDRDPEQRSPPPRLAQEHGSGERHKRQQRNEIADRWGVAATPFLEVEKRRDGEDASGQQRPLSGTAAPHQHTEPEQRGQGQRGRPQEPAGVVERQAADHRRA